MGIIRYIGNWIEKGRKMNEEYAAAYRSCFEGCLEQVERKLAVWDSVYESTRPRRSI